jgi:RHS repeat-associated protein
MHAQPSDALPKIMLARYYGANLGRFLSPDPSRKGVIRGLTTSWNLYAYVYNNPLRLVDRTGLTPTIEYAAGTGQVTRGAVERYAQTSSMKQIPSSVKLKVGNKDNIVTESYHAQPNQATTGEIALELTPGEGGKYELTGAEVAIDETEAGPGGARRSDEAIEADVGEELGHFVDAWKHPEEVANPTDPRDTEAQNEKKKMDEELKQKDKKDGEGDQNKSSAPSGSTEGICIGSTFC